MNVQENRLKQLSNMIGNTPLLEIKLKYKGKVRTVYAKAEFLNLSGSIKDRMAFHIIKKAYESGRLKPGDMIAEATSGNTGIAFSAIGRAMGHPVTIFMPEWMSEERKSLIRSYGANIRLVTKEEGGFLGSVRMTEELAAQSDKVFLSCQFTNEDNCEAHYLTTGPEIWWQLKSRGLKPDAFVAGVGTGGTTMGIGRFLKEQDSTIKVYPLEPESCPTMKCGGVGPHRIQGIGDEFIPQIVKLNELDDVICVDDGDSIIMAQKIASQLGIGVGISSGANLLGALKAQELLGEDAVVATVFADDNKKYLTTDLMKAEPVKPGFISTDVSLISVNAIKRAGNLCCDPDECYQKNTYSELNFEAKCRCR